MRRIPMLSSAAILAGGALLAASPVLAQNGRKPSAPAAQSAPAPSAAPLKLWRIPAADASQGVGWLDEGSVSSSGGVTQFRMLGVFAADRPSPNGKMVAGLWTSFKADCKAETLAAATITMVDRSGQMVLQSAAPAQPLAKPRAGTPGAHVLTRVCLGNRMTADTTPRAATVVSAVEWTRNPMAWSMATKSAAISTGQSKGSAPQPSAKPAPRPALVKTSWTCRYNATLLDMMRPMTPALPPKGQEAFFDRDAVITGSPLLIVRTQYSKDGIDLGANVLVQLRDFRYLAKGKTIETKYYSFRYVDGDTAIENDDYALANVNEPETNREIARRITSVERFRGRYGALAATPPATLTFDVSGSGFAFDTIYLSVSGEGFAKLRQQGLAKQKGATGSAWQPC